MNQLKKKHQEAKSLLQRPGINGVFLDLVDAVRRHRVVPFVGAGLSKHMDLPTWREALEELRERLLPKDGALKTQLSAALSPGGRESCQKTIYLRLTLIFGLDSKYRFLRDPWPYCRKLASGCVVDDELRCSH